MGSPPPFSDGDRDGHPSAMLSLATKVQMELPLTIAFSLLLAYANGANGNFKGVATLHGSGTAGFRGALAWSTLWTLGGSLVAVVLASGLAESFRGGGLLPEGLRHAPQAFLAVAVSGAATILIASYLGLPTSTTHALTGALLGAGLAADPGAVQWSVAISKFAQPLLWSPLVAMVGAALLHPLLRRLGGALGVTQETCVCLGQGREALAPAWSFSVGQDGWRWRQRGSKPSVTVADEPACELLHPGRLVRFSVPRVVDAVHYFSSGAVCFARAVNDTPKVAALLLVLGGENRAATFAAVGVAMAAGGILGSRRVAETMSRRITRLDPGQGLTANLVTAGLVLGASRLGLPVSTTHVSCGALFGIGLAGRSADPRTIARILLAWVTTLPLGAVLGAGLLWTLGIPG